MPVYNYIAKTIDGKNVKGEVEASSESEVKIKLRARQLAPLKIAPKSSHEGVGKTLIVHTGRVKPKEMQIFTRQFAVLIGAGVPIMQSLEALIKGSHSKNLKKGLTGVAQEVGKGKMLGEAMSRFPSIFDRLYINLVRAGEQAGALDIVLDRLALYIEKSVALRNKVKGALWYPAIIIVVAIVIISGIMLFVVPSFVSMFQSTGKELPALTQLVIKISQLMGQYWFIILVTLVGGIFGFLEYRKTPSGRKTTDIFYIQVPLFGELIQKSSIARLSRTLSTLLSSGVSIIDALDVSAKVCGNWVIEQAINRSKESISKGKNIATPLSKEKIIPSMVVTMVGIGEQTGALDTMLSKIADFYEDEVDNTVNAMTSLIEPILMVVLGGIIAAILIAMYLPVFKMAETMG